MVFKTALLMARNPGPDEFWRKRKIFRMAAHFIGRRRNCYSIAVRYVHRALAYATKARALKKQDMSDLWTARIDAACNQHNISNFALKEGLERCDIMLNKKSLANLAIWEPRTFESLAAIAKEKITMDEIKISSDSTPIGRDMEYEFILKSILNDNENK